MNEIHEALRERYGSIARSGGSESCCDDNCCTPSNIEVGGGYGVDLANNLYGDSVSDLPFDVTGLSLGCGDPVAIAGLNTGERVLDLGSGGGIDCFLAAKQVGETGYVIGVDMTDDMLAKANASKVRMDARNVEFRKGQIEDLPIKDNSIDVIMSNCVINLSPNKETVFAEAFRVLKPGGRVSISDIVTEGDFSEEMRQDAEKWAACVSGAIDTDDYIGMIRDAGFVNIEIVDKVDADEKGVVVEPGEGIPRIFSARITAQKPQ